MDKVSGNKKKELFTVKQMCVFYMLGPFFTV